MHILIYFYLRTKKLSAHYSSQSHSSETPSAIAVDNLDNIYVTGTTEGRCTVKYSADGTELWSTEYQGAGNFELRGYDITVNSQGDAYVAGGISTPNSEYTIIKYSPAYHCVPAIAGDINNDCEVDFTDFALMASEWLRCNLDPPEACW